MKFELPPPIPPKPQAKQRAQEPPKKQGNTGVAGRASLPPSLVVPPPLPPKKSVPEGSQEPTPQPSLLREFEAGIGPPVASAPQSPQKIQRSENETTGNPAQTAPTVQPPSPSTDRVTAVIIAASIFVLLTALVFVYNQPRAQTQTSAASPAPALALDDPEAVEDAFRKKAVTEAASPPESSYSNSLTFPSASPSSIPTAIVMPTPAPTTYRIVNVATNDPLNLREGPGSNYPVVARLFSTVRGIVLGPRRISNGSTIWQEISIHGHSGFVNEDYLEPEKTQ